MWTIDTALAVAEKKGFSLNTYKVNHIDPVIAFNQEKPPFDKLEVRQAFQYAFDYDAMRRYYRGYALPTSGVISKYFPYSLKSLPVYERNLGKAKELLAKAGVKPTSLRHRSVSALVGIRILSLAGRYCSRLWPTSDSRSTLKCCRFRSSRPR